MCVTVDFVQLSNQDLQNNLGVDSEADRKKIMLGLETLRAQAKFEPMKENWR